MNPTPSYKVQDWLWFLLVLAVAAGARVYYVYEYADKGEAGQAQIARVQLTPQILDHNGKGDIDLLVENLRKDGNINGFRSHAPLSTTNSDQTAHTAPGYPMYLWLVRMGVDELKSETIKSGPTFMWLQAALSSLAAACYFAVGRRAFHSTTIGTLAGLLCALNPFWIVNVAEMGDGVLMSFMLALVLALGVRAGQVGGPLTSFLFGLVLAALPLIRAAMLPFAFVALMWFCLRSRNLRHGWLYAVLVVFGFLNGSAAWAIRNWQTFQEPIPVVDSMYWHFWVGNNKLAGGNPIPPQYEVTLEKENLDQLKKYFEDKAKADEDPTKPAAAELPTQLRYLAMLGKDTVDQIAAERSQPAVYGKLAPKILEEIKTNPEKAFTNRLTAAKGYFFGLAAPQSHAEYVPPIDKWDCCRKYIPTIFLGTLVGMLLLALIGWRWSALWRRASLPLSLAVFWIPLPYVLTYAEYMHGARLPLDGPLMVMAAVAICGIIPFAGGKLLRGEAAVKPPSPPQPIM